jgi:hypothetical protein
MLSKLKYVLLAVPLMLLMAASDATECYTRYQARCCALGDGTANSGFTPGKKTYCVNSNLGSPWYCPAANPTTNITLKNDLVWRQMDCPTGAAGCWSDWRNSGIDGKCTQWRYTCSTTVHGQCDPISQANYTCMGHELFGVVCENYGGSDEVDPVEPEGGF